MKHYSRFIFESYSFDERKKILNLKYSYDNELFFNEIIEFPTNKILNSNEILGLDNIFKYLHIVSGISYYKLFIPEQIEIKTFKLSKDEADFFNFFYLNGLGEFRFKNNIMGLKNRISFPYIDGIINYPSDLKLKNRMVIPIGGGKDSITTLEILKKHYNNLLLCSVGYAKPIQDVINISGLNNFRINRTISKQLLELNDQLYNIDGYNGHIPVSGIMAFIFCAASIIYDFNTVLMSNERSANTGNIEFDGIIVNHQWSKSFEFEKYVNNFFKKYVLKNFDYISFLRPISEIHIAKLFSEFKKYHKIFVSCNKNYKIKNRLEKWCCKCDKCRFVYLILSVFLKKNELINIFGQDLLNDDKQIDGFRKLCGLVSYKPFECVGEIEESIYAILNTHDSFKDDIIVKKLKTELSDFLSINLKNKLFTLSNEHLLDKKLYGILEEAL